MITASFALLLAQAPPMVGSFAPSPASPPPGTTAPWIGPGRKLAYRVEMTFDDSGRATACRFVIFLPPTDQPPPTTKQVCALEMEIWAKYPRKPGAAGRQLINRYLPVAARLGASQPQ